MDLNGSRKQKMFNLPNQDWADWLSNDGPSPAAKEELRKQRVKQAGIYTPRGFNSPTIEANLPAAGAEVKSVVINLHLPKLSSLTPNSENLNKLKSIKLSHRRVGITAAVVLVLFLIKLTPSPPASPAQQTQTKTVSPSVVQSAQASKQIGTANLATASSSSIIQPSNDTTASASSDRTGPNFTPVVPASEPQLKKPTFGRTSYSSGANIYTIADTFGNGPVTINETVAPLGSSAQALAQQNANKISKSQVISLPAGDAYVTDPTSSGQQTAVLAIGNVLVFVISKIAHSVSDWQTYLKSLN